MAIRVNSYDELLELAENQFFGKIDKEAIKFGKNLNFNIRLKGDTWDGLTDYRLALYIIEIQKSVDRLFKEAGVELAKEDRPIVKFKVEEGSTKLLVQFNKTVRAALKDMSSKQKTFVITLGILSIVGALTGKGFLEYKDKQAKRLHNLEMQKMADKKQLKQQEFLVGIINSLTDKIPNYQKPNRVIERNLQEGDEIENSLILDQEPLTKKQFKKLYPTKEKLKAKPVYLDGKYLITAIKLKAGRITIEQGQYKYDCISSLNEQESEALFKKAQKAHAEGNVFELDLKITADYFAGSKTLKRLIIYEIGEQRENAQTIESLIGDQA